MYNSYNSLKESIQKEIENQKSVLNKFPDHISRHITQSCSKYLAQFTSYQLPFKSDKLNEETRLTSNQSQKNQYVNVSGTNSTAINNSNLNLQQNANLNDPNIDKSNIIQLDTPEQVNWTLEASSHFFICFCL
jgi:hypothetical protein